MTHRGPNYIKIKETGITADVSSYTEDRFRGEAPSSGFKWIDRFNHAIARTFRQSEFQ